MATKDIVASIILTGIFILLICDIFNYDDPDIEKKNSDHKKILNEIEIVLSKYSK